MGGGAGQGGLLVVLESILKRFSNAPVTGRRGWAVPTRVLASAQRGLSEASVVSKQLKESRMRTHRRSQRRGRHWLLPLLALAPLLLAGCGGAAAGATASDAVVPDSWALPLPAAGSRGEALLDLRPLNEGCAGEHGYVHLDAHGDFVRGDGASIRFWGVIANAGSFTPAQWDEQARWLASLGVNMVRRQMLTMPSGPGSLPTELNLADAEQTWRLVAAMRRQGIYTALTCSSVLLDFGQVDMADWGIDGYADDYRAKPAASRPWTVLFFNQRLRDALKARLMALYQRPNPYTGIPLAQDPSILWNQLQTEDSLLFYTLNGLRRPQLLELSRQFSEWLIGKYGSVAGAFAGWQDEAIDSPTQLLADDAASGTVGLYNIWEATQPAAARGEMTAGKAARLADQVEFLAEVMRAFNQDMATFFHQQLGSRSMVLADNWRPADPESMLDAERWSYLPGEVVAENRFFGGVHAGAASGWKLTVGDHLAARSVLHLGELSELPPFAMRKVDGRAGFITSTGWGTPNRYQCEGPLLCAAYGCLDGMDGFCWEGFSSQPTINTAVTLAINPTTAWFMTWNCAIPPFIDTFPAAALIFRSGYLRRGATAVHEVRPPAACWACSPPAISDHVNPWSTARAPDAVDPLAFFVGPVSVAYGAPAAVTTAPELAGCIDRAHQRIASATGELLLDYGRGLCRIAAPKAQGVVGFLQGAGAIDCGAVTIASMDAYAGILVVPLDDAPIASSHRLLIQTTTTAVPSGWSTCAEDFIPPGGKRPIAGERVLAIGGAPWRIANNHATITIRNPDLSTAWTADAAGCRSAPAPCSQRQGALTVALPPDCFYVIVQ
jgi:hypothetical protein